MSQNEHVQEVIIVESFVTKLYHSFWKFFYQHKLLENWWSSASIYYFV